MFCQHPILALESPGMGTVIRIHSGDQISLGILYAGVQRSNQTLVRAENGADSGIFIPQAVEQIGGPVGRPVVHRDYLDVAVGLTQKAPDGSLQRCCGIVYRKENGDEWDIRGHTR
jgi:hypothetical protein